MSRRLIEVVQVLVDRIEKNGYQQRAREENAFDLNKRLTEAEGWVAHWKQARQEAHEAGELMQAEIESLRTQLANAQQELSEQSMVANIETQQDAAAWQQQVDSANAEVAYLRARLDEERSVSAGLREQLDAARADNVDLRRQNTGYLQTQLDAARAVNVELQGQLDVARADNVEIRKRLNDETDRHRATNSEKIELFQQKESANQHNAELVKARDAAHMTILAQRAGIERLQAFVNYSRRLLGVNMNYADVDRLRSALAELDAGTEFTPVAERCPECDGSGMVDSGGFGPDGKGISVPCGGDCRGKPCPSQPAPVAEPIDAEGGQ